MKSVRPERHFERDLPVFPLTGSLLLPATYLPLNVFEERYRNLVEDVLASDRLMGMIQPVEPAPDNFGPATTGPAIKDPVSGGSIKEGPFRKGAVTEAASTEEPVLNGAVLPALYGVGCAGTIRQHQLLEDGRYLIVLEGVWRFTVVSEHSLHRGYRRLRVHGLDDRPALADRAAEAAGVLLDAAAAYCGRLGLDVDLDLLRDLPAPRLVNTVAATLPFAPEEKQALLETPSVRERGEMVRQLIEMSRAGGTAVGAQDSSIPS